MNRNGRKHSRKLMKLRIFVDFRSDVFQCMSQTQNETKRGVGRNALIESDMAMAKPHPGGVEGPDGGHGVERGGDLEDGGQEGEVAHVPCGRKTHKTEGAFEESITATGDESEFYTQRKTHRSEGAFEW